MSYETIIGPIIQLLDTIFIYINGFIYDFINFIYQIFVALAGAQIFTSEQYQSIANRIYIIIGVVSLFLISYSLLKAIVDPDGASKGDYSARKIITNVIAVIMLIGFTPVVFSMAYKIQDIIVSTNVIQKIIYGQDYGSEAVDDETGKFSYDKVGRRFANDIFTSFLYHKDFVEDNEIEINGCYFSAPNCDGIGSEKSKLEETWDWLTGDEDENQSNEPYTFETAKTEVAEGKKNFQVYANFGSKMHGENKVLEYNPIFQLLAGIIVIYVLINYCIDLGVRAIKLGYFQLIAPIPILTILIPGQKKVFNNWLKNSISTFVDVFFRIALFFLAMLAIRTLPSVGDSVWANSSFATDAAVQGFARVFLIIGILIFIKQAPKLISDIFGIQGGGFKLGIKDKLGEMAGIGGAASAALDHVPSPLGAVTGAAGAAWTAAWNRGKIGDAIKLGAWNGAKGKGNQFNKQRTNMWESVYGMKGPTGAFGGRPLYNKVADELKNTANDRFLQYDDKKGIGSNSRRIREMERSGAYNNIYRDNEREVNDAISTLATAEASYVTRIEGIKTVIQTKNGDLQTKQADADKLNNDYNDMMNEAKSNYVKDLEARREAAVKSGNAAEVAYYGQRIQEAQSGNATNAIMDYMKTADPTKYGELSKNIADRKVLDNDIKRLNSEIELQNANLATVQTALDSDNAVIDARKALSNYKFIDSDGKQINVTTAKELRTNPDAITKAVTEKTKSDFRKANDEYKWRTEAEEKEKREVDISQAKKDPTLQAQAEMWGDIFKNASKGDKK